MKTYTYTEDRKTGTLSLKCENGFNCYVGSKSCISCKFCGAREYRHDTEEFKLQCGYEKFKIIKNIGDIDKAFIEIFSSGEFPSYFDTYTFKENLCRALGVSYAEGMFDKLGMSLFFENKKVYTLVRIKRLKGIDVCMYIPVEVDLTQFGYRISEDFAND